MTIKAMGFSATCNDTGQGRAAPARGITVVFRQGNATATLSKVDASDTDSYEVVADVVIPETAVAGPAQLQLGWAAPMPLVINS